MPQSKLQCAKPDCGGCVPLNSFMTEYIDSQGVKSIVRFCNRCGQEIFAVWNEEDEKWEVQA